MPHPLRRAESPPLARHLKARLSRASIAAMLLGLTLLLTACGSQQQVYRGASDHWKLSLTLLQRGGAIHRHLTLQYTGTNLQDMDEFAYRIASLGSAWGMGSTAPAETFHHGQITADSTGSGNKMPDMFHVTVEWVDDNGHHRDTFTATANGTGSKRRAGRNTDATSTTAGGTTTASEVLVPPLIGPGNDTAPHRITMLDAIDGFGTNALGRAMVTTDGGEQWRDLTPYGVCTGNTPCAVQFLDPKTGWIAELQTSPTRVVAIYRTTGRGDKWRHLADVPYDHEFGGDVQLGMADEQHGWLEVRSGGNRPFRAEMFVTEDGGASWTRTADPTFGGQLTVNGPDGAWITSAERAVAGEQAQHPPGFVWVCSTSDGGANWHTVDLPAPDGYAKARTHARRPQWFGDTGILPVEFEKAATGGGDAAGETDGGTNDSSRGADVAASATAFYRSTDAGATWALVSTMPTSLAAVSFSDAAHGHAAFRDMNARGGGDPGSILYATTDGGATWNPVPGAPPLPAGDVLLDFVSGKTGWMVLGGPGSATIKETTDGGRTWENKSAVDGT